MSGLIVEAGRKLVTAPLCIDLFCGQFGWGTAFAEAGYRVVGFDIADMCGAFGLARPQGCQLVLQDALTLHGSQLKDAAVIVASPPCQEFSKYAMPFGALWQEHDRMDDDGAPPGNYLHKPCPNTYLFRLCFRLQKEAIEATKVCRNCEGVGLDPDEPDWHIQCRPCDGTGKVAGRYIPLIVENVRGAPRFVGPAQWSFGSFYLWGDVPALMPITIKRGQKVPGFRFNHQGSFQSASVKGLENGHGNGSTVGAAEPGRVGETSWFHGKRRDPRDGHSDGVKQLHSRGGQPELRTAPDGTGSGNDTGRPESPGLLRSSAQWRAQGPPDQPTGERGWHEDRRRLVLRSKLHMPEARKPLERPQAGQRSDSEDPA